MEEASSCLTCSVLSLLKTISNSSLPAPLPAEIIACSPPRTDLFTQQETVNFFLSPVTALEGVRSK